MATSTERSRALKQRRAEQGLAQFNVWLPKGQHAEFKFLIETLEANPDLRAVSVALQDIKTGRMRGVKLR